MNDTLEQTDQLAPVCYHWHVHVLWKQAPQTDGEPAPVTRQSSCILLINNQTWLGMAWCDDCQGFIPDGEESAQQAFAEILKDKTDTRHKHGS